MFVHLALSLFFKNFIYRVPLVSFHDNIVLPLQKFNRFFCSLKGLFGCFQLLFHGCSIRGGIVLIALVWENDMSALILLFTFHAQCVKSKFQTFGKILNNGISCPNLPGSKSQSMFFILLQYFLGFSTFLVSPFIFCHFGSQGFHLGCHFIALTRYRVEFHMKVHGLLSPKLGFFIEFDTDICIFLYLLLHFVLHRSPFLLHLFNFSLLRRLGCFLERTRLT
mmetsp:Transcript_41972/g.101134  ORF Transcript_41972/g.101134 Transcript_41972/m.101134 type:complete len:222 (-) Transcript_41972:1040-1705(-)